MPRLAVSLLLAVAVLAGAARASAPSSGGAPLTNVTLIGDSIAGGIQLEPTARAVLARGIALDVETAVCRRLVGVSCPYQGSVPPTLVGLLPTLDLGSTVVVAMGYNDIEDAFASSIESSLQALDAAGVSHILWLTLRAERQSYLRMNETIRAAAATHPELTVVDWNLYSRSHPEWFQPDGLHLNVAGAVAMARLIHQSLDALGLVAVPAARTLAISTRRLPAARVGRAYRVRLAASGAAGRIRWARIAGVLPAGLRLAADGRVTGTPLSAGRRVFTLRAVDTGGRSATRRFSIVVAAG